MSHGIASAIIAALLLTASTATAQLLDPPELTDVPLHLDSGAISSRGAERSVLHSEFIHVRGAVTMRLYFAELTLGAASTDGLASELRITSLHDGAQQTLDASTAKQWGLTSAWFNGNTLLIELIADTDAEPSRVRIASARVAMLQSDGGRTICGPDDDRLPSNDPRIGRVIPNGCTAWLIDDANHCLLTAGHCASANFDVIEFNYPLSNSEGVWQHAHPDDQYVIDQTSLQWVSGGTGNDWAYFGCFANPQTGLTPFGAQGVNFTLAAIAPPAAGQMLRITGNGTTNGSVPPEFFRAQKTHTGAFLSNVATMLTYDVDTTGGNSGSPIIDESTGEAIGIHTHGGCSVGGGANVGTAIHNPSLQTALANPLGVCAPPGPTLQFTFPSGVPTLLDPGGDVLTVMIDALHGGIIDTGSVTLHIDTGGGFVALPMTDIGAGLFQVNTPPTTCGDTIAFYIAADMNSKGNGTQTLTSPADAPGQTHIASAAAFLDMAFADNGETNLGWSVVNELPLDGGAWDRGIPVGGGDRGDPRVDFDGSGSCWLTENLNGNSDVDGGPTRLVSPAIDLSGLDDPVLTYARWFDTNTPLGGFEVDRFEVEVSDDGGQNWHPADSVQLPTTWVQRTIRIADHVTLTSDFRVRFSAFDAGDPSIVECAVDAVRVFDFECSTPIPGDIDLDGVVNVFDLIMLLEAWGSCDAPCPPSCAADITNFDGSGTDCQVNAFDLLLLLANWSE